MNWFNKTNPEGITNGDAIFTILVVSLGFIIFFFLKIL